MKSPVYPQVEMKQIERHGITIDYCPKSGGVWLDKGELEKLIELEKEMVSNDYEDQDNVPFGDDSEYDVKNRRNKKDKKRRKKRENPLEEIFDFDFF